jgi:hypothetical protein
MILASSVSALCATTIGPSTRSEPRKPFSMDSSRKYFEAYEQQSLKTSQNIENGRSLLFLYGLSRKYQLNVMITNQTLFQSQDCVLPL